MKRSHLVSLTAVVAMAVLALVLPSARGLAGDEESTVKIVNLSDWVIAHFYLSPVDEDEWGADQLEDQVIGSGDSFTLTDVPCDLWDIMIVDEDGDECVLTEVDLCGDEAVWKLTDEELLSCEMATAE